MSIHRRQFIDHCVKAGLILPFVAKGIEKGESTSNVKADKSLNILILGGTSFLGPHQIAYAKSRGHSITTFTRGKTKPAIHKELFNDVEQLIGDREDNLEALKGKKWDAVIDNSGRKVDWTIATAQLLKENVDFYLYISSVSVHYPYYKSNIKEDDTLVLEMPSELDPGEKGLYEYGIMKANSELAAISEFGKERSIVVRPTFMTGPADRTDRFIYWPTQLSKGGKIIIPGKMSDPVQCIDVRDIADWTIRLIEEKAAGTYNGVGPASPMSIPAFVYGAHAAFGTPVEYFHIDDYGFLEENNLQFVAPWVLDSEKFHGMLRVDNQKAIKNGLSYRPLATTIKDTHFWWYSSAVDDERRNKYESDPSSLHNRQVEIIKNWVEFSK